jgi:hypothetical protein
VALVEDIMVAFAGAEGNLNQNSYADFVSQNPFVSPTLLVSPTDNTFDVYAGLRGKVAESVSFSTKVSWNNEKNKPFFISNRYDTTITDPKGYHYANSFGVVYDNLNTLSISGELRADFSKNTSLSLNGMYQSFSVSDQEEAWNLPQLRVSSTFNTNITDKLYTGIQLFFVGERTDLVTVKNTAILTPETFFQQKETLDSYFDLNAHIGYKYNKRFTAFLKGNNLANQQYNRWANFPVQGIQVLVGAQYKFDF